MLSSCGTYYYIIQGIVTPRTCIRPCYLVTSKMLNVAKVAIKVCIPDDVKIVKRWDSGFETVYYTADSDKYIEEFNPIVLTYVYGGWRQVVFWDDLQTMDIFDLMVKNGYTFDQYLGFVNEKQIDHYTKFQKMLFG